jgi:hypothetical protein
LVWRGAAVAENRVLDLFDIVTQRAKVRNLGFSRFSIESVQFRATFNDRDENLPFFVSMRACEFSGVADNLPNADIPVQASSY